MPLLISFLVALFLVVQGARAETVYVLNEQDNTFSVIDGGSFAVVATIPVDRRPRGTSLSADRRQLYVAVGEDNRIDVVDLASRTVEGSLPSGEDQELFVLHPDERQLFVATENDNIVSVVDPKRRILTEIEVGAEPESIGVSPDSRVVVNTSETASMLHVIDGATVELIVSVLVNTRPRVAQVSADNDRIWARNRGAR